MIYRSNLTAPDLSGQFKLKDPPLQHMGHDMPSDPDYLPHCGYWTHDEAAILYTASAQLPGATWLDIGSRLGWTAAHILAAGAGSVWGIDPEYRNPYFRVRAQQQCPGLIAMALPSSEFFEDCPGTVDAAVIDGCHDAPEPSRDALGAVSSGAGVILFHDFQGLPVREAVTMLTLSWGWHVRVYDTPNGVALCWRDKSFVPPDHTPDPAIDWAEIRRRHPDFDYAVCE